MSNQISDLITSRNEQYERMALSEIITSRSVQPGLMDVYFCGSNRKLYRALMDQFDQFGEINPDLLDTKHRQAMEQAIEIFGNCSKQVVGELHKHYLWRSLGLLVVEGMKEGEPDAALRVVQGYAAEALLSRTSEDYDHHNAMSKLFAEMERASTTKKTISGTSVGIPELDEVINGIELGKTYVVGALKKTGKSRFMVHCAVELAKRGLGVLLESLEMNSTRLNLLGLAHHSGIDSSRLMKPMRKEEYVKVGAAASEHAKLPWLVYNDHDVSAIRARIVNERGKHAVDVVFVDFIQRLRDDSMLQHGRTREIERVSQDLADLGRDLNVAVVVLTQLSGVAERIGASMKKGGDKDPEDGIPDISYVKESQGISENADAIIILHNPERHNSPYTADGSYCLPTIYCKVEQRDGASGIIIPLRGDLRTCRFSYERDLGY
jgi:replicative DNA helicase